MNTGGRPPTDRVGQRFGRLLVTGMWRDVDKKRTHCQYLCDCGKTGSAPMASVVAGYTKSCGCLVVETRVSPITDRTGNRYGRLTVLALELDGRGSAGERLWRCHCDCGNECVVGGGKLHSGNTKSCGCLHADVMTANASHGMSSSSECKSWTAAKDRCFNSKNKRFRDYGGRGITMAPEWRDDFAAFFACVGPRPTGRSLDRIDNDGNYEPGNVRWATRSQQQMNRRAGGALHAAG